MDRDHDHADGRGSGEDHVRSDNVPRRFGRELVDRDDGRRRRRPLPSRWWFWVLVGLLIQFVPWPPTWADAVFLRGTLPLWSNVAAPLTQASGRSLSALLLLALLAVTLIGLLAGRPARGAALRGLGGVLAVLALTFPFVFGLGYHTTPLEDRLGSGAPNVASESERQQVRSLVLATLQAAAAEVGADGETAPLLSGSEGIDLAVEPPTPAAAAALCVERYLPAVLGGREPRVPQRVKAVPEGILLRMGFSGVVSPWLLEPHVDPALPGPSTMAVALHELAHTAGFAREAEAEAVGLLAGLRCEEPRVRYAAALKAATWLLDDLSSADRDAYLEQWPAVAVEDLRAASAIAKNYRSPAVADAASRVYDTYLTSQGGGGMSDYSRGIDLVVLALTTAEQ